MTDERISSLEDNFNDVRKIVEALAKQTTITEKMVTQVATKLDIYLQHDADEEKHLETIHHALNDLLIKVAEMPHQSGIEVRAMLNPVHDKIRAIEMKMSHHETEDLQAHIDIEKSIANEVWHRAKNHVRIIWAIFIFIAPLAGGIVYYIEQDIREDVNNLKINAHKNHD